MLAGSVLREDKFSEISCKFSEISDAPFLSVRPCSSVLNARRLAVACIHCLKSTPCAQCALEESEH